MSYPLELVSCWLRAHTFLPKATERKASPILSKIPLDDHGLHQIHWGFILTGTWCLKGSNQVSKGAESVRPVAKPVIVDKYPPGYGRVAAFEDCDPSFSILRKFGWLHSRVLLHLQDELQELEEELESLDSWELSSGDPSRLKSRRLDDERPNALRKALLIKIRSKLAEYGEIRTLRIWKAC